jgi:hypothetical protein
VTASASETQRCARVIGDGEFAVAVVGAAEHQADLDILAGGRSAEGALKLCAALLQPKPGNPEGRKVAVIVHSCTVGYLAPEVVPAFLAALAASGYANAACETVIFGGRLYGEADGQFGIKLNAALPFKLVDPVARASAPPRPPRAEPPRRRPSAITPPWARPAEPAPTRPEPPSAAPEPQSITEPQQPARVEQPAPPARSEPPPPAEPEHAQTHVFRTQQHGRGIFGSFVLAAALLFNLAMALWLIAFWTGLFELADAVFTGGEWETKFRGMLGSELIVAIWIAGAVVLALAAYVTRGKTVVIDEIVESPDAPMT